FFFQAEDGIRAFHVTGVQTCALPILRGAPRGVRVSTADLRAEVRAWLEDNWDPDLPVEDWWARVAEAGWTAPHLAPDQGGRGLRSEARRVGKKCRTQRKA